MYRLLESLANFLDRVEIGSSENATVFSHRTFTLYIQNINPLSFKGETFVINLDSIEKGMNITGGIDDFTTMTVENEFETSSNATATIYISEELVDYCSSGSQPQRLSYSIFLLDTFFHPKNSTNQLASLIIGARITCSRNGTLPTGVTATFLSRNTVRKRSLSIPCNLLFSFA